MAHKFKSFFFKLIYLFIINICLVLLINYFSLSSYLFIPLFLFTIFKTFQLYKNWQKDISKIEQVIKETHDENFEKIKNYLNFSDLKSINTQLSLTREQLKQRIEKLNLERGQLFAILSSMAEGVIAINTQKTLVHMNESAGHILSVNPQESFKKNIYEITRIPEITDILESTLSEKKIQFKEMRLTKQQKESQIEMKSSPIRNAQGDLVGAVLVLGDVTELKKLEVVRRDFVANVSHELKTPVAAIHAIIETMIDDPQMEEDQKEKFLQKVKKQTVRLTSLINDLLTLATIESSGIEIEKKKMNLLAPLRESIQALSAAANHKEVKLNYNLPKSEIFVMADREALREIFDNLISNSIKYTASGGEISVSLDTDPQHVTLKVKDSGIGIDPKYHDRIFERFYRVDKARSRELGGTGLGLSIVKHHTLALQGTISVDSSPGKGSLFTIQFPIIH